MRVWGAFSILVCSLILNTPVLAREDWSAVFDKAKFSVVKITFPESPEAHCSGFWYGRNYWIVTARHCLFEDGKWFEARVGDVTLRVMRDFDNDDLLLTLPNGPILGGKPLYLAPEAPRQGSEVLMLGYAPPAILFSLSMPIVGPNMVAPKAKTVMPVKGKSLMGMSGGPVVNDKGELVGMIHAHGNNVMDGISFNIAWEALKQLPK